MSARHLITAAIAAGALTVAAKALRHADEARTLIGPTARLAVEEVRQADITAKDALSVAQAAADGRKDDARSK